MSAVLKQAPQFVPITEADLDAVAAIEQSLYPFPWTRGNFRDSLQAGYSCWAVREAGVLIAYAIFMVAAGEAHLLNLSVAAALQRRGYGRALLRHVADIAREHGARTLFLEVRPSNGPGRRLYESAGFRQIGVRRGYYPAHLGREDALVFALTL